MVEIAGHCNHVAPTSAPGTCSRVFGWKGAIAGRSDAFKRQPEWRRQSLAPSFPANRRPRLSLVDWSGAVMWHSRLPAHLPWPSRILYRPL